MLQTILTVVAFALTAPPASLPAGLEGLSRCTSQPIPDGGVQFLCGDRFASLHATRVLPPRKHIEVVYAGMVASVDGEVRRTDVTRKHAGGEWPAIRFRALAGKPPVTVITGELIVGTTVGGEGRVVTCGGRDESLVHGWCGPVQTGLMALDVASLRLTPHTPRLFGRPLPVPAGCTVPDASDTSFRIECGAESVLMYVQSDNADQAQKVLDTLAKQLLAGLSGAAPGPDEACVVAGQKTRCRVVRVPGNPKASLFRLGRFEREGQHGVIICAQPEGAATAEVCRPAGTFGP